MQWVLAGLVAAFTLALVVGGLTGRVRARSCCAPAVQRVAPADPGAAATRSDSV